MINKIPSLNGGLKKQLILTRIFNAPSETVFKAWTETSQIKQWWGPHGFTNPVCEMDVRPGGSIHIDMMAPDGVVFPMGGTFRIIESPRRIVFMSTAFEDEEGNNRLENLNTITFTALDGKTKLHLQADVLRSTPEMDSVLDGMEEGWRQSLDKLEAYLAQQSQKPLNKRP
jgi:uncharacterized protein YndB with AHSA1/START domain